MAKSKEENKSKYEFQPENKVSVKEKRNASLRTFRVMTKSRAKLTLKMLNPKSNLKLKPKKNNCIPSTEKSNWPEKCTFMWDSNTYIMKNIRSCILTNNWNCLTKLLLLLYRKTGKSSYFIKQMTKLNLMKSPADSNGELLTRFLDSIKMFSRTK